MKKFLNNQMGSQVARILLSATMMIMFGGVGTGLAQTFNPGTVSPLLPINRVVYAAKFVCGFKPGYTPPQSNVLNGPGVYEYRDFEPGSYSTALNVFYAAGSNANTNINVLISVPESPQNAAVNGINSGTYTIPNFGTAKVDCEDIAQALNGPLPQISAQEVVEAFVYITRPTDDLVVEAIYTHSSQIGSLGGETLNLGGIGLGSSIHVQHIEAKSYSVQFPRLFEGPIVDRVP